jgi:hypothetical protein
MEELDLVKEQLARLPTRNEVFWFAINRYCGGGGFGQSSVFL